MATQKKRRPKKENSIDKQALLERYGEHEAPEMHKLMKSMLSKPNPNAPAKVAKH